jgi:hypothetical protein
MATAEGDPSPQPAVAALSKSGMAANGAPWVDDPKEFAWSELADVLKDDEAGPDIWVIGARKLDLANADHRFGLSMVAAMARVDRNEPVHIVIMGIDGMPDAESLPTLLRSCQLVDGTDASWSAKVLVAAMMAKPGPQDSFRLRVTAHKQLGLWFEVGPTSGEWSGCMAGVSGGEATISNHAVGLSGGLPEKTVLEYKLEGIELDIGDDAFVAWAVKNKVTDQDSYYVKIEAPPRKLLIGEHPDDAEDVVVVTF